VARFVMTLAILKGLFIGTPKLHELAIAVAVAGSATTINIIRSFPLPACKVLGQSFIAQVRMICHMYLASMASLNFQALA